MDYRTLGATGTLVSSLCLGTMTFGAETDEDAAQAVLNRYLDAGGNFIDTADVYQHGVAEEIVGRWIAKRGRADDLVGVSNFTAWQLQRAILMARHGSLAPIVTLQPQYNLLTRELEWELLPLCLDEGVGLLPWSPLGGGWLSGKSRSATRGCRTTPTASSPR